LVLSVFFILPPIQLDLHLGMLLRDVFLAGPGAAVVELLYTGTVKDGLGIAKKRYGQIPAILRGGLS